MSKPEDFKFDNRIRDRLIRNQTLTSAEVKKHLEQLPDLDGEYEVMNDTPQPAVAPARSEIHEEPLVFDGIRRLQALADVSLPSPARYAQPVAPISSSGMPAYREPESRTLGTPLRSALMESEISGVGAGAVSAALGAMAAEARSASVFGVATIPFAAAPEPEAVPVTLRSEAAPKAAEAASADDDDDDVSGDDDDDDDEVDGADDEEAEFGAAESSEPKGEEPA
jgi:hypothetical protein